MSNFNPNNVDVTQFNDFIAQASEMLTCDAECQKSRKAEELKQKYLDSQTNLKSASSQVQSSYKNYLTFTQGDSAYSEYEEQQFEKDAKQITKVSLSQFQKEREEAKRLLGTYNGLLVNYTHVAEYYERLKRENAMLQLKWKNATNDVETNDRKSFYEDQNIDRVYYFYRVMLFFYAVSMIILVLLLLKSSTMGMGKKVMIIIMFALYPFMISILFYYVFKLYDFIVSLLPKNVYKTI